MLAGVSVDYYMRLERGNTSGVSETVLEAIARALQLDEAEHAHLFDLARAQQTTTRSRRRSLPRRVRPGIQRMLDAMNGAPAFVRNGRMDVNQVESCTHRTWPDVISDDRASLNHPESVPVRLDRHFFKTGEAA